MHKCCNIIIVILLIFVSSFPACAGKKPISLSKLMYIVHREICGGDSPGQVDMAEGRAG